MTEKLLSKREAAERLGVSEFSMNRLMPEIGFVRVGNRRVLFSPQAIQEYIQARTVKPSPRYRQTREQK
jgi:excisionase family DNA binding protein